MEEDKNVKKKNKRLKKTNYGIRKYVRKGKRGERLYQKRMRRIDEKKSGFTGQGHP